MDLSVGLEELPALHVQLDSLVEMRTRLRSDGLSTGLALEAELLTSDNTLLSIAYSNTRDKHGAALESIGATIRKTIVKILERIRAAIDWFINLFRGSKDVPTARAQQDRRQQLRRASDAKVPESVELSVSRPKIPEFEERLHEIEYRALVESKGLAHALAVLEAAFHYIPNIDAAIAAIQKGDEKLVEEKIANMQAIYDELEKAASALRLVEESEESKHVFSDGMSQSRIRKWDEEARHLLDHSATVIERAQAVENEIQRVEDSLGETLKALQLDFTENAVARREHLKFIGMFLMEVFRGCLATQRIQKGQSSLTVKIFEFYVKVLKLVREQQGDKLTEPQLQHLNDTIGELQDLIAQFRTV